jgi:hypothetical protein
MSAEEAKGQATAMPEMHMPETAKLGKTITRQERRMPVQKCHRRDIQEPVEWHQAGMMMMTLSWKELVIT